jgi:reductive dehalogenase
MQKFHPTISRRDFMKALGLTGMGAAAVAGATPVFHDLDELSAGSAKVHKWPWFISETDYDETTVEIDWSKATRADFRHILQCGWQGRKEGGAWIDLRDGPGTFDQLFAASGQRSSQGVKSADPYRDLRAQALSGTLFSGGLGYNSFSPDGFLGPTGVTPEGLGVSKWTGTPEEASIMLRQVAVLLGASDVALVELNPATSRNMIISHEFMDGKPYIFEDVDQAYETGPKPVGRAPIDEGKRVIPNKCRWVLQFCFDEASHWMGRSSLEAGLRYPEGRQVQLRIQTFIKGLGYQALGPLDYTNNLSENLGMAVLGGTGELGRNNLVISPRFGAVCGQCSSIITDLQLEPTKPIDAGIRNFCFDCMKCAEYCPSGALSRQGNPSGPIVREPTWEPIGPWMRWEGRTAFEAQTPEVYRQSPGVNEPAFYKQWWYSMPDCIPNYDICDTWGCGVACPFKDGTESSIHDVVMSVVGTTGIFNSFFRTMDDFFSYSADNYQEADTIEAFWNGKVDLPRFGTETSRRWR